MISFEIYFINVFAMLANIVNQKKVFANLS